MDQSELIVGIGGAAGDGVASAGNTLALSVARQGLGVYAYNSYQSVIRGGHSWLRLRLSGRKPLNHGDQVDALIALNQDTLDRHLQELMPGGLALYNSAKVKPGYEPADGRAALPACRCRELSGRLPGPAGHAKHGGRRRRHPADGAGVHRPGIGAANRPSPRSRKVVAVNVAAARAGYDYAAQHFQPLARPADARPTRSGPWSPATSCWPWGRPRPAASSTAPTR